METVIDVLKAMGKATYREVGRNRHALRFFNVEGE